MHHTVLSVGRPNLEWRLTYTLSSAALFTENGTKLRHKCKQIVRFLVTMIVIWRASSATTEGTNGSSVTDSEAARQEMTLSTTEEGSHVRYKCDDDTTRHEMTLTAHLSHPGANFGHREPNSESENQATNIPQWKDWVVAFLYVIMCITSQTRLISEPKYYWRTGNNAVLVHASLQSLGTCFMTTNTYLTFEGDNLHNSGHNGRTV